MRSSFSVAFATLAGIASYFILWAPISNAVDIRTIISFVLGAIATSSAEDRPNNKRADLIEKYGEDGYNALIAEACGLANIPYAVSDSDVVRHQSSSAQYGTDVSFPIHNTKLQVSTNYPWLPHNIKLAEDPSVAFIPHMYTSMPVQPLGNRAKFYEEYMSACRDKYRDKGYLCDLNEEIRVEMNMRQPRSMQNFTELGFKKIRAPSNIRNLLTEFWNANYMFEQEEKWPVGNTYTNHWSSPTSMTNIDNTFLLKRITAGSSLKRRIWDTTRSILEEWTGQELSPSSLYGIRVYKNESVLAPHVDRHPLITSAVINVAQDVTEAWPLELYAHDGLAYNVTLDPGDMLLYESHSVIHGRPFPLNGRYYANVFIHFEPTGCTFRHSSSDAYDPLSIAKQYEKAKETGRRRRPYIIDDLPHYITPGTEVAKAWKQPSAAENKKTLVSVDFGTLNAHQAAARGDLNMLKEIGSDSKSALVRQDSNGWQPIHEAARGGHEKVVAFLVEHGADVNARTNKGKGGSPLWWALQKHSDQHECVKVLEMHGAQSIDPDTKSTAPGKRDQAKTLKNDV